MMLTFACMEADDRQAPGANLLGNVQKGLHTTHSGHSTSPRALGRKIGVDVN